MKRLALLWATTLLTALPSHAQLVATEPISGLAINGSPLERWFPNDFDPTHPKRLTFRGSAEWFGPGGTAPLPLHVTFDYFDSFSQPPQTVYLTGWTYPGDFAIFISVEDMLPYCPQQVSIHFSTNDPYGYAIGGIFTHECLVPEPAEVGLVAGLGLLGVGVYRRVRKGASVG
jgi:hypothetical protein